MRRISGVVSILFTMLLVSGCAVPAGVTVASWAIDGVSYLATSKSITDHGISFVAGQDCALHRAVTEFDVDAVCKEYNDPEQTLIAVADASEAIEKQIRKNEVDETFQGFDLKYPTTHTSRDGEPQKSFMAAEKTDEVSIEELANFETASGGPDQSDFEILEDPASKKGFNLVGIWQFFKDL